MAKLGNIAIFDTVMPRSGAAFALVEAPMQDCVLDVDKCAVELHRGQRDIVVRINRTGDPESTLNESYRIGQRALDLLSIRSQCHLVIRAPALEHTLWWAHDDKTNLRAVRSIPFQLPDIRATASVIDNHSVAEGITPVPPYSTALRYYRMAQTTIDLYDAFRNLFLALEHLLSDRFPYKGGGELPWLNRALRESGDITLLGSIVSGNDAVERGAWIAMT